MKGCTPLKVLNENKDIIEVKNHVDFKDLEPFIFAYPKDRFINIINTHKWINKKSFMLADEIDGKRFSRKLNNQLSTTGVILSWSIAKQIYRFDADFVNELTESDNICITKDAFKYLPVNSFYVEIVSDPPITDPETLTGMFITVKLINNVWAINTVGVAGDIQVLNSAMEYSIKNEDMDFATDYETITNIVKESSMAMQNNDPDFSLSEDGIGDQYRDTYATMARFVYNILAFMATTTFPEESEDCIDDTFIETTKFVKTNKKISNKVKTTNVGFRIGSAFRKWKVANESSGSSTKTGIHVCPHYRRAHYHSFWYGKKGEERVKRVKWIAGIFVNAKEGDDIAATIHKVENEECAH